VTSSRKAALVLGGYVAAVIVAFAVGWLHSLVMSEIDPTNASGGMAAFGDALLFLAVFGVAAVPPTAAGLYFLRAVPAFWSVASAAALVLATSALAALYGLAVDWTFAPLRLLLAPGLAVAFGLALLFAPTRATRRLFLVAMVIELIACAGFALSLWQSANVD